MSAQRSLALATLVCLAVAAFLGAIPSRAAPPAPDRSAPLQGAIQTASGSGMWHAAQTPVGVDEVVPGDWWAAVQQDIRQSEYHVTWQDETYVPGVAAAYQAPNRAHNLRTYFTADGPVIIPRVWSSSAESPPWRWGLQLIAWEREGALRPVGTAILHPEENRIE